MRVGRLASLFFDSMRAGHLAASASDDMRAELFFYFGRDDISAGCLANLEGLDMSTTRLAC